MPFPTPLMTPAEVNIKSCHVLLAAGNAQLLPPDTRTYFIPPMLNAITPCGGLSPVQGAEGKKSPSSKQDSKIYYPKETRQDFHAPRD